jgi:polar amino acid transport system permease protein
MTTATESAPGGRPPERITAVPVRHPGRWLSIAVIVVLAAMFVHMLVTNKQYDWSFMVHNMFKGPVLRGAVVTVELTFASMVFGIVLGIVVGVMRLSGNPILRWSAWLYTWFFRAIPRFVLLTILGVAGLLYTRLTIGFPFGGQVESLFGGHGQLTIAGVNANNFFRGFKVGLFGLGLSEAAYMAEIVRAGIMSVDTGQMEAAQSVGMSPGLAMRRVVLPQAMRIIIPPTGNETIAMLKDTALVIAVPVTTELFFQLNAIGTRTFRIFPLLVASILWYLALSSVLMVGQYFIERRFSRGYGGFSDDGAGAPPPPQAVMVVGGNH